VYAPPNNSDNNKFFTKFSKTLDKLVAKNGAKNTGFKSFLTQLEFKNVKSQAGTIAQATRIDTWIGGPEVQVIAANILEFERKLSPDHARISLSIEVPGTSMQAEETGGWWVLQESKEGKGLEQEISECSHGMEELAEGSSAAKVATNHFATKYKEHMLEKMEELFAPVLQVSQQSHKYQ